ncbi:SPJ_0845 family protein [Vagococcus silagei]
MGLTYRKTDKLEKMLEDFIVVPEKDAKTEGTKEPKTDEKLSFNVNVSAKENK